MSCRNPWSRAYHFPEPRGQGGPAEPGGRFGNPTPAGQSPGRRKHRMGGAGPAEPLWNAAPAPSFTRLDEIACPALRSLAAAHTVAHGAQMYEAEVRETEEHGESRRREMLPVLFDSNIRNISEAGTRTHGPRTGTRVMISDSEDSTLLHLRIRSLRKCYSLLSYFKSARTRLSPIRSRTAGKLSGAQRKCYGYLYGS